MDYQTFRSRPLVIAVLLLFVLVGEGFAQIDGQAQSEFTRTFQSGKKLYEDGEHKEAALKLLQLISVIAEETNNNGIYLWQIPATTADGSDYKVRVSCSSDSSIYGESLSFIISTGHIAVTEPISICLRAMQGIDHDLGL